MEKQTEKKMIETSGRLIVENGPGRFTLDVLSKQPVMQGFDIFTLVRKEEEKDFRRRYNGADQIISRIKGMAKKYLTSLIDRGKAQKVFAINTETKILVKEILGSFQALMNDMQLTDKMVRDFKKYQSATD